MITKIQVHMVEDGMDKMIEVTPSTFFLRVGVFRPRDADFLSHLIRVMKNYNKLFSQTETDDNKSKIYDGSKKPEKEK